jgi:hypothetical protein
MSNHLGLKIKLSETAQTYGGSIPVQSLAIGSLDFPLISIIGITERERMTTYES